MGGGLYILDDRKNQRMAIAHAIDDERLEVAHRLLRFGVVEKGEHAERVEPKQLYAYFAREYKEYQGEELTEAEQKANNPRVVSAISTLRIAVSQLHDAVCAMRSAKKCLYGIRISIDEPYFGRVVDLVTALRYFLESTPEKMPDAEFQAIFMGMATVFGQERMLSLLEIIQLLRAFEREYNSELNQPMKGIRGIIFGEVPFYRDQSDLENLHKHAKKQFKAIENYASTQASSQTA